MLAHPANSANTTKNFNQNPLSLEIHQDEKWEFFEKFDTLTLLQKRIWAEVVRTVRKNPVANPKQATVARWVKCHVRTVIRAYDKFQEWGWLNLAKIGCRGPNRHFVPHYLLAIDLFNRQYFKSINVRAGVRIQYSRYRNTTSERRKPPTGVIQIPEYLQKLEISHDSKLKLSLVPEHIYQETLYQCQKKAKKGFKPDEGDEPYFVGTAIRMAQNRNLTIDWRRYYAQRE